MKHFLFLLFLLTSNLAYAKEESKLSVTDFLSWPRSNAAAFGCFLENHFKHRDKRFNCSLENYKNKGDPHKNVEEYYEGPLFPKGKESKVHSEISSIDLSWEHGDLQSVSLTLKKKMNEAEVRKVFKLPAKENYPRPNVMSISIQQCSIKATCVLIQGFDHQGSGD